jgi:hypothetical protein
VTIHLADRAECLLTIVHKHTSKPSRIFS